MTVITGNVRPTTNRSIGVVKAPTPLPVANAAPTRDTFTASSAATSSASTALYNDYASLSWNGGAERVAAKQALIETLVVLGDPRVASALQTEYANMSWANTNYAEPKRTLLAAVARMGGENVGRHLAGEWAGLSWNNTGYAERKGLIKDAMVKTGSDEAITAFVRELGDTSWTSQPVRKRALLDAIRGTRLEAIKRTRPDYTP